MERIGFDAFTLTLGLRTREVAALLGSSINDVGRYKAGHPKKGGVQIGIQQHLWLLQDGGAEEVRKRLYFWEKSGALTSHYRARLLSGIAVRFLEPKEYKRWFLSMKKTYPEHMDGVRMK